MAFGEGEDKYSGSGESRTLLTITGDSAKLEGKFDISQSIEIDCDVTGELQVNGQMVIQKDGFVNADVKTIDAEIIGRYEGNMEASGNVEIKETGIINGNIKTDSLIINKGGIFSGNVTRISTEEVVEKEDSEVSDIESEEETEEVEEAEEFETDESNLEL